MNEVREQLRSSDYLVVPWGALHIPGIAQELEDSGFRVSESSEFTVIRFRSVLGRGPDKPVEISPVEEPDR
jgi:hypothetical protein